MTKEIKNDPNLPLEVALRKIDNRELVREAIEAQERARTTVIDASDRIPQFGDFAPGMKGPTKQVHKIDLDGSVTRGGPDQHLAPKSQTGKTTAY